MTAAMDDGNGNKEKLVVEVVAAHNLMPKDGEGSSSPFVEVEFENQRLRTQVKYKDLNPVWNQKLVFHVKDVADLPYRSIEINVFNEKRSSNSRNFLGKVRVSGVSIAKEGEEVAQLYTLEKRSLFSHIRGEITLKFYLSTKEVVKEMASCDADVPGSSSSSSKKNNKFQQQSPAMAVQQQQQVATDSHNNKKPNQQSQQHAKPGEPNLGDVKPIVITAGHTPSIPAPGGGVPVGVGGLRNVFSGRPNEFSLKETSPRLGGGLLHRDKTSSTYDLVEQMQYLYVRILRCRDISASGEVMAEVKLGNYRGITKRVTANSPEWDQVFAFSNDSIQSSVAEILVKEKDKDEFLGRVWFDLNEVPKRVPPDSQLAPQWHRMEDTKGDKSKAGEVMLSIWFRTQADEAFAEAWHSKATKVHFDGLSSIKFKVYLSPKTLVFSGYHHRNAGHLSRRKGCLNGEVSGAFSESPSRKPDVQN